MANEEQLSILRQGVKVWNGWREENPDFEIDLREVRLRGADLSGANLKGAFLFDAGFRRAYLSGANLSGARLTRANLREADLYGADLSGADFMGADLSRAYLINPIGADLTSAVISDTIFGDLDLSRVAGLEDVIHRGPSSISTDVFARSKGTVSEVFLRGCGLSDTDIEYAKLNNPNLSNDEKSRILYKIFDLRASQAIQISPLFISYSHADNTFVDKVESKLNENGIRFWRDIHDMKAGRMETQIDRAINQNRTVLLVLSERSLTSDWVAHEVRTARGLEKETGQDVLCPVALDDSWKDSRWPKRVMEQIMEYNILDFSEWQDDSKFEGMFRKLIDGLELFYKG